MISNNFLWVQRSYFFEFKFDFRKTVEFFRVCNPGQSDYVKKTSNDII